MKSPTALALIGALAVAACQRAPHEDAVRGQGRPTPACPPSEEWDVDYLRALRKEQLGYGRRIQAEIDEIERQLLHMNVVRDPRDGRAVVPEHIDDERVQTLLDRRDRLEADMRAVETATPREWESTRERIVRDLDRSRI
jgi:hypothetical protein